MFLIKRIVTKLMRAVDISSSAGRYYQWWKFVSGLLLVVVRKYDGRGGMVRKVQEGK